MMRILVLALGLQSATALRIQAKDDDAPESPVTFTHLVDDASLSPVTFHKNEEIYEWMSQLTVPAGATGVVAFNRQSVPFYDPSDEPFQGIDFAGRFHGGVEVDTDYENEEEWERQDIGPGVSGDSKAAKGQKALDKARMIAEAIKFCTPSAATKLARENPKEQIPNGDPLTKSALPENSFYAKFARQQVRDADKTMGCSKDKDADPEGPNKFKCQIPKYLPAREAPTTEQKIPRIIWMTMSDHLLAGQAGPFHYSAVSEHFKANPEYEWIVTGDKDADDFMKSDEVPEKWKEAYKLARNGAERSDIWRYVVLYIYGGVYMDSDMKLTAPYRTFIDGKADIVQQVTQKGSKVTAKKPMLRFETSQYGLFLAPKSKLLELLLNQIHLTFKTAEAEGEVAIKKLPLTIALTGPQALAQIYIRLGNVCGMRECPHDSVLGYTAAPGKVCGTQFRQQQGLSPLQDSCQHRALGQISLLNKARDFNTGTVWHKADICQLAETRKQVSHWASSGQNSGGKKYDKHGSGKDVIGHVDIDSENPTLAKKWTRDREAEKEEKKKEKKKERKKRNRGNGGGFFR